MKLRRIAMVIAVIVFLLFFVPVVPVAASSQGTCVFCPVNRGVDYQSVTYAYLGIGVYHTAWGTFGFALSMPFYLVADVSSVGMTNVYEQLFITFNQFAYHCDNWFNGYWRTPEASLSTIIGLSFLFVSVP